MLNILNLLTASILAVSPIVSQPKMAVKPEGSLLYEKTEYLANDLVVSSYIAERENLYEFCINFEDNKLIDFTYSCYVEFSSDAVNIGVYYYDNINDETNEVIDSLDLVEWVDSRNSLLDLNNTLDISFDSGDNNLSFDFYCFDYDGDNIVLSPLSVNYEVPEDYVYFSFYDVNYFNNFEYDFINNNLYYRFLQTYVVQTDNGSLLSNIFDTITFTIEDYVELVVNLFSQVLALFIVNGQLTILGILLIFTVGIGVVKFGFEFIKSLLRL